MELNLAGKRALVTGSTAGIGEAIAKTLAREGAKVVINGRSERRGKAVAEAIEAAGGEALLALGNVASDEDADRVGREVRDAWGGVDILENNAAGFASEVGPWGEAESRVRIRPRRYTPACARRWARTDFDPQAGRGKVTRSS